MSTAKPEKEEKRDERNDKDELEKILGSMGISEHGDGLKGDLDVYVKPPVAYKMSFYNSHNVN